jgi:hypothetical protein
MYPAGEVFEKRQSTKTCSSYRLVSVTYVDVKCVEEWTRETRVFASFPRWPEGMGDT